MTKLIHKRKLIYESKTERQANRTTASSSGSTWTSTEKAIEQTTWQIVLEAQGECQQAGVIVGALILA
jgi:outer membrane protease